MDSNLLTNKNPQNDVSVSPSRTPAAIKGKRSYNECVSFRFDLTKGISQTFMVANFVTQQICLTKSGLNWRGVSIALNDACGLTWSNEFTLEITMILPLLVFFEHRCGEFNINQLSKTP